MSHDAARRRHGQTVVPDPVELEIIIGQASGLRHATQLGGSAGGIYLEHTTWFDLDEHLVSYSYRAPLFVDEGDTLAVAGEWYRGVFRAAAYRNLSTGAGDVRDVSGVLASGVLFSALPLSYLLATGLLPWYAPAASGWVVAGIYAGTSRAWAIVGAHLLVTSALGWVGWCGTAAWRYVSAVRRAVAELNAL